LYASDQQPPTRLIPHHPQGISIALATHTPSNRQRLRFANKFYTPTQKKSIKFWSPVTQSNYSFLNRTTAQSNMIASHHMPIIYSSPPLLKPKPIRPTIDTNVRAASSHLAPAQPKHVRRPSILRASTLDGRSLTEVINAARRASLNERPKRASKSPASVTEAAYSSHPQSRRMSLDEPTPPASSSAFGHPDPRHPLRLSSAGGRVDYFADPYAYDPLAHLK